MVRFVWLLAIAACTSSAPGQSGDDGGGGGGGAGGAGGGGGGSAAGSDALVECVTQTNMYRATLSVAALTESSQLETYAATGAQSDYQAMTAHSHFEATGGGGIAFAENECPGFEGWNLANAGGDQVALVDMCIQAFYDEGPGSDYSTHGHYINMMNPDYSTLGCGIYVDQASGDWTLTQDYGM